MMNISFSDNPFAGNNPKKMLADYAMVLDMVGQLTGFATEREQVEKIFDIFTIICGPEKMHYLAFDGEMAGKLLSRPMAKDAKSVTERLKTISKDFAKTVSEKGLSVLIKYRDEKLGVLELDDVTAPELINHYFNMALNIQSVLGLAISNARLYQKELASRGQIQNYANRLSMLHDISLTLKQEAGRESVLKNILAGAARLTGAEMGAIFPVDGQEVDTQSLYYAPHINARFGPDHDHDVIDLYRSVVRARDNFKQDVTHVSAQKGAEMGLRLPDNNEHYHDLLIGTLRDSFSLIHSHFVLINKANGAAFTPDDVEMASLLVAQGSVALSNAENYEREHSLADSLLTALLSSVPVRKDLDLGLLYRSAGQHKIGGDFYEFIDLGDNRIALAIADVCGKGLRAASYNAMLKYLLRAYVGESDDPGICLARLNKAILEEMPEDRFVTMGLALIDTSSRIVTYSSAGHPYPIIYSGDKVSELKVASSVPLGVIGDFEFVSTETKLNDGASMLMFTDGIIEAKSPGGDQFGQKRLLKAFRDSANLRSEDLVQSLLDGVINFSQGELKDDAVLMAARFL